MYPTPASPGRGRFIHQRLLSLSRYAQVKVIAPVSAFDFANCRRSMPIDRQDWSDGAVQVSHPAWLYPPGGTVCNAVFLASALWRRMGKLRHKFAFDLIDAHFGYPESIAAAWLAQAFRVPFCVTLRGSELLHRNYVARRHGMEWALRRAGRVIAVSKELAQFARECGVPCNRIAVISNGVSSDKFRPSNRADIRKRLGIPEHCRLILSAGHLIALKRHDWVIRAMRSLDDGAPARLVIAGGKGQGVRSSAEELRELVARLDLCRVVTFTGELAQQELADWMSAADVFCTASAREGWPNVVHEALACGTPVVATSVGAIPDLLPSSDYGLIADNDDPLSFEAALRSALAKEWNRQSISYWAHSRSWEQVGTEVFQEFSSVLRDYESPSGY